MRNRDWPKIKLKELCHRIGDGLHGTPSYVEDSKIYFINGNNLKFGKIIINKKETKQVSLEEASRQKVVLNNHSLLLSINGTLGSMAFFDGEEVMLGKSAAYLNFKENFNSFYYYYFQLPGVQQYFYNVATGSTIKNLSLKSIQNFKVPLPPKMERDSITDVLSAIDQKIEINNQINAELEGMAKLVYDYWFVQFDFPISASYAAAVGKPELEGKPYKASGGKMVYNEELKREIPEGWGVKELQEFAETGSGGTPLKSKKEFYENPTIPWINSGEVNEPFIVSASKFISEDGLAGSSAKLFPRGTILMAMYGATAGKVSLIDLEACTNQAICAVLPEQESFKYFIKFGLEDLYDYLVNLSSGSARDNLSQTKIKHLDFLIPSKCLIDNFHQIVNPMMEKILINLKENQELASLRDWLLPMLMNGQATVGSPAGKRDEKLNSKSKKKVEVYGEVQGELSPNDYREVAEDEIKYGEG